MSALLTLTLRRSYHSQVNALLVLERIQQSHEPFALGVCQNIPLRQNMSDLIKLEEQLLAHDLERANLASVFLLCQEYLTISTLTDLSQNLKVPLTEADTALSQICALTTGIFMPQWVVDLLGCGWRGRILGLELAQSILARANIC